PFITGLSASAIRTGSSITITGEDFTGTTAVTFGGTSAASFVVDASTSITATVAAGASGAVTVTNAAGSDTFGNLIFIEAPVFTSTPPASASALTLLSYKGTTTSPVAVSYAATILPPWLTFSNISNQVSTLAGNGTGINNNGTGTAAGIYFPRGVTTDAAGNYYVSDYRAIRKITPAGVVTTFAGNLNSNGEANNNNPLLATFNRPYGMVFDSNGNLFVADEMNNRIRKITPAGEVSYFAGYGPGVDFSGDGIGTSAYFYHPRALAIDANDNIYVTDYSGNKIRKITPAGVVTTIAGSGDFGIADGTGAAASFNRPSAIAIDNALNLYVTDFLGNKVRKITPAGVVTTFAGNGTSGITDGPGTSARFNGPTGIVIDIEGNLYVTEQHGNRIRKITPAAVVSTMLNIGVTSPMGIAKDNSGNFVFTTGTANLVKIIEAPYAQLTGVPKTTDVGVHNVELTANNGGTTTQTFSVTVTGPANFNTQDIVKKVGDANFTLTDPVSNNLVGAFTYSSSNAAVASLSGKTVTIGIAGTAVITVTQAADGLFLERSSTFLLTVTGSPVFTGTPVTTIAAGIPYLYSIATNLPSATALSGTSLPAWLSLTGNKSIVSTFNGNGIYGYSFGQPVQPGAIAIDRQNNIYLFYNGVYRMMKYDAAGNFSIFAGSNSSSYLDGTATSASFQTPSGIATDKDGNIFVGDANRIRKISPAGVVTTFAGAAGGGALNSVGTNATFNNISSLAIDGSGNIYVSETGSRNIRKVTHLGEVSTFAGSGFGYADGMGIAAKFTSPAGLGLDASGNLYVADATRVRKITPDGNVTTIAGSATVGFTNANGLNATFSSLNGLVADAMGNIFVVDAGNHAVRKIAVNGDVTTIAGLGTAGIINGSQDVAKFSTPHSIAMDNAGNLYVTDRANNITRKISAPTMQLTGTPAIADIGSHNIELTATLNGLSTNQNYTLTVTGPSTFTPPNVFKNVGDAAFTITPPTSNSLGGFTYSSSNSSVASLTGNTISVGTAGKAIISVTQAAAGLYAETVKTFIVSVTGAPVFSSAAVSIATVGTPYNYSPKVKGGSDLTLSATTLPSWLTLSQAASSVETFAGSTIGTLNGTGLDAQFDTPTGIFTDAAGNAYVSENHRIRKITTSGIVTTYSGGTTSGYVNSSNINSRYNNPRTGAIDASGNIYVADASGNNIRRVNASLTAILFAGSTLGGNVNSTGSSAQFNGPRDIAINAGGEFFVADNGNFQIRKLSSTQVVTAFAGSTQGYADGIGSEAQFYKPYSVATDVAGNIYVADNNRVRIISPAGAVATLAGTQTSGFADGNTTTARFNNITGIAVDATGNIYVADAGNHRIRKITTTGIVTTIAGNGTAGFANGAATASQFSSPQDIAMDAEGNLLVADMGNHLIRKIVLPVPSLAGTPVAANVGMHPVVLKADDGVLNTTQNFSINIEGEATFTVANLNYSPGTSPVTLTDPVSTNTAGAFTYSSSDPAVASISGKVVTIVAPGTTTITVTQAATAPYLQTVKTFTLTVNPLAVISNFAATASANYGDADISPAGTSTNSNVALVYSSSDPTIAAIVAGKIQIKKPGVVTISANQVADANFGAATELQQVLTIGKKSLSVTLNATPLVTKVYDKTNVTILTGANYDLTGIVGADIVTVTGSATYNDATAGNGKVVTAGSFVLAGADKDNY
ncbi:MAG: hypothetical protein EOP51_15665, partial [Sphingobacteriales bacterium]